MSFARFLLFAGLALQAFLVSADGDTQLCGQYQGYNSSNVPYAFNNNAYGDNDKTAAGYQCLTVLNDDKDFTVTYKWTGDPGWVKGYPNMKADPQNFPVQLWNISHLNFAGNWNTYVTASQNDSQDDQIQAFRDSKLRTNVALDMYLAADITASTQPGPPIEIMIWPWWFPTVKPLGWQNSTPEVDTVNIDGTDWALYHGYNDDGQLVFSWLAQENLTSTSADYAPLLTYVWNETNYLDGSLWVGQLEFGTEIMYAGEDTTFEASGVTFEFIREGDPDDTLPSPSSTSTSTATRTSGHSTATAKSAAPKTTTTNIWLLLTSLLAAISYAGHYI